MKKEKEQKEETPKEEQAPEEPPKKEPKKKSRVDKELYWILGTMLVMIFLFLAFYSLFQSLQTFEYQGIEFTKENFGDIPMFKYSYYTTPPITGQAAGSPDLVNLYLRIDPRENNVPVEGEITPRLRELMYISVNGTNLTQCEYSSVGISNLAAFFARNYVPTKGALPDENLANESEMEYATCDTHPTNLVILIQSGEETKITKPNENCHVIEVANCEVLPAIEKFIIQSIVDARERKG